MKRLTERLKDLWKTDQDPREDSKMKHTREIMERLIRPLKVHWEIAERLLKDHQKTIFLKDHWNMVLNIFKNSISATETTMSTERSAKTRERPWRPLKVHWKTIESFLKDHWTFLKRPLKVPSKTIERSSKFHSLSAVLPSVEWWYNGPSFWSTPWDLWETH